MKPFFSIVITLLVAFPVLLLIKFLKGLLNNDKGKDANKTAISVSEFPYFKKALMTEPELKLYKNLVKALPEFSVFCQVQFSAVAAIPKGPRHQEWLNRINRMSLDFVICNQNSSVACVIELDDPTHSRKSSIERDLKKDNVLQSTGIPFHRFRVEKSPTIAEIKKILALN